MTIPLVGRVHETTALAQWCDSDRRVSLRVLTGRAGSGKTRLALELIEVMGGRGWDAGFVTADELERFRSQQNLSAWGWQRPTLVVVDYAAAKARTLHGWLQELADSIGNSKSPLRILLLERHADPTGGWWQEAFGTGGWGARAVQDLLDPATPVALSSLLDAPERRRVLSETLDRAASPVRPPPPGSDPNFDRHLAELSWGGEPLFLMMAALLAADAGFGRALSLSRTDLALTLADYERDRIQRLARAADLHAGFLVHMAAYVTLCQGLDRSDCIAAVQAEQQALARPSAGDPAAVADALHEALPGETQTIEPVLPDMIGEAVILHTLAPRAAEGAETVLRAFDRRPRGVAGMIVRCAQDYAAAGHDAPLAWLNRLIEGDAVPLERLFQVANELPVRSLALAESAAKLHGLIVQQLRPLAEKEPDAFRPDLAMALGALGATLRAEPADWAAAAAAFSEGAQVLKPQFVALPKAFAPLMGNLVSAYLQACEQLERQPDGDLLREIAEAFEALRSS